MADPDDPGEDLIEKLGRAERQLHQEERGRFAFVIAIATIMLLGMAIMAAFAGENPPPLSQEDAREGGAVKLTRPDGTPIYVNPHSVAYIRGPLEGEHGHTTIVFANGAKQTVVESVQEIIEVMKIERGQILPPDDPP